MVTTLTKSTSHCLTFMCQVSILHSKRVDFYERYEDNKGRSLKVVKIKVLVPELSPIAIVLHWLLSMSKKNYCHHMADLRSSFYLLLISHGISSLTVLVNDSAISSYL